MAAWHLIDVESQPLRRHSPLELQGEEPVLPSGHEPGRVQVVLERNRFYRGSRPANVERIVWTISAPDACRAAVEQDELDYCTFLAPTAAQEIAAESGVNKGRFFVSRDLSTNFFAFNHDRPAFRGSGQIPLKQAINWAIDRPALVRAAGYLSGKRKVQILPPAVARGAALPPPGEPGRDAGASSSGSATGSSCGASRPRRAGWRRPWRPRS